MLFRRQVYSNSSTGLEKSVQGVRNTPPSPSFGVLLSPAKGLVGKEVFTLEKIIPWRRGQLQCDKGIEDRVSSIRITLSDLDLQQVASRATGHFQPCFPASRPVNRPVFASTVRRVDSSGLVFISVIRSSTQSTILLSRPSGRDPWRTCVCRDDSICGRVSYSGENDEHHNSRL